jgi:hypothetical protein
MAKEDGYKKGGGSYKGQGRGVEYILPYWLPSSGMIELDCKLIGPHQGPPLIVTVVIV